MKHAPAEILREYGPFPGIDGVHGVSFDGQRVWFASGERLNALDPESGDIVGALDVAADAGTAFDGKHLFQIADAVIRKIDPRTGEVLGTIPAPGDGGDSGLAWAEGTLWVGETVAAGSIRSILRPGPCSAPSNPTASSRVSPGSTRALARHLAGRGERFAAHRPRDGRGARVPRNAGGDRCFGARIGPGRPLLLWRRKQRKGESHPPAKALRCGALNDRAVRSTPKRVPDGRNGRGAVVTGGGRKRTGGFRCLTGQKQTFAAPRQNRRGRPRPWKNPFAVASQLNRA